MLNWFACFPAGRNTFSSWCALIAIRYAVKPRGYWDHEVRSLLAAALSLPVMMLRDHLMWHWPLTWLFIFACLPPRPRVYLSGRYRGRPAVSSAGPHCYVTAAGSTVTHVKEAENDLIHSATSRNPPSPLSPPPPPSIPLPSFCLRSIYYSICLFPQEVQLALAHMQARAMDPRDKAAIWQRNSDFTKLKDGSQGQIGTRDSTAVSKCQAH